MLTLQFTCPYSPWLTEMPNILPHKGAEGLPSQYFETSKLQALERCLKMLVRRAQEAGELGQAG